MPSLTSGPRHNIDMYDRDGAMRDSSLWGITYYSKFFMPTGGICSSGMIFASQVNGRGFDPHYVQFLDLTGCFFFGSVFAIVFVSSARKAI
jgi:hypothetical protein